VPPSRRPGPPAELPAAKGSKVANGPAIDHIKQVLFAQGKIMQRSKHLTDATSLPSSPSSGHPGQQRQLVQAADVTKAR